MDWFFVGLLTPADDVVDEGIGPFEEVGFGHGFPVVAVFGELVLEEIHVCALVPASCREGKFKKNWQHAEK